MFRHLDGSPKPADPVSYRQHEAMHMRCPCGRAASKVVGLLARDASMGEEARLWQLVERLRSSKCGRKRPIVDVGRWRGG